MFIFKLLIVQFKRLSNGKRQITVNNIWNTIRLVVKHNVWNEIIHLTAYQHFFPTADFNPISGETPIHMYNCNKTIIIICPLFAYNDKAREYVL